MTEAIKLHSVRKRTGGGFWRRERVVQHRPAWETIAWSRKHALQVCQAERLCIATRKVAR